MSTFNAYLISNKLNETIKTSKERGIFLVDLLAYPIDQTFFGKNPTEYKYNRVELLHFPKDQEFSGKKPKRHNAYLIYRESARTIRIRRYPRKKPLDIIETSQTGSTLNFKVLTIKKQPKTIFYDDLIIFDKKEGDNNIINQSYHPRIDPNLTTWQDPPLQLSDD